jgi:4-diphosphocytidyl-2-C-methyl-D-erythritol kinase
VLPPATTLFAPAKLTLSLRVSGIRDDGMHLIDAEMVTLDFGDTLRVQPGDSVVYRGTYDGEGDGSDLVSRALTLVQEQRSVHVTKRIPPGAGLGGGSSDAAAILRAAGFTDLAAAAKMGADIAFCLCGGRARVTGIGEAVEPLPFVATTVTLLTPTLHCSTPAVYRAWDEMGAPVGEHGNDLEAAALAVEPGLAAWRDRLSKHAGKPARLAGSGSTWFVEGAFPGQNMIVATATPSEPAGS